MEAQFSLPVTPFMDRNSAVVPKQQLGFYSFIARPMFEALDGLISMQQALGNLNEMQAHWEAQLHALETAAAEPPPLAAAR